MDKNEKEKMKNEKEKMKIEKEKARVDAILRSYGLYLTDPRDIESVKKAHDAVAGVEFMDIQKNLLSIKPAERMTAACLKGIYEQNWIIIRYLDKLNRKLENKKRGDPDVG